MATVISMQEKRLLKSMQADVNVPLAHILELSRKFPVDGDGLRRYSSLNEWFEEIITREIIRRKLISQDIFLCGLYIAALLAKLECDLKKYAFDFMEQWSESSDPAFLKIGGDFCFVLCGGFPERCDRRLMKLEDYQEMGASFYDWFYSSTGKLIGHYMSLNFRLMQQIVNHVLNNKV